MDAKKLREEIESLSITSTLYITDPNGDTVDVQRGGGGWVFRSGPMRTYVILMKVADALPNSLLLYDLAGSKIGVVRKVNELSIRREDW